MSQHTHAAEELAERAGGYIQAVESAPSKTAGDYASMANACATLSLAQRIADVDLTLSLRLAEIRSELNRIDSPSTQARNELLESIAGRIDAVVDVIERKS